MPKDSSKLGLTKDLAMVKRWINLARNHTRWVIAIASISLIGLILIQFYFISVEVRLEQVRLDETMDDALLEMHHLVERDSIFSSQLIRLFDMYEKSGSIEVEFIESIRQQMGLFVDSTLSMYNLEGLFYDFAFYHTGEQDIVLSSKPFAKNISEFTQYSERAGWRVRRVFGAGVYRFGLFFHNQYWYLFRRVAFLLILSLILIGLLVGAFMSTLITLKNQKQLAQMKNDFINNLTHELKTPIFASSLIHKVVQRQISSGENSDRLRRNLTLLEEENDRLKVRVEKVLAISQLEHNGLPVEEIAVDLHQVISKSLEIYQVLVVARKGNIVSSLKAASHQVFGDQVHLENMVSNLLDNALKYSLESPEIKVSTWNEHDRILLQIDDCGTGMPAAVQARIFDKFYRAPSEEIIRINGFGLGLNYVKKIVQLHLGSITVKSEPGQGSTFTIILPVINQHTDSHGKA